MLRSMLYLLQRMQKFREHDRWTPEQVSAYQVDALRRLREHTYVHSPFYQQFHKGLFDRPLEELPVLTKANVMEHFDELVTDRSIHLEAVRAFLADSQRKKRYLNRYWVNATSGSTGVPGIFLFNATEWSYVLASFGRAHEWAGLKIGLNHHMKMASVASSMQVHLSAQVGAALHSWWMPSLRLAASEPLEKIVSDLNAFQPQMFVAYASMARILAAEQLAGRLHISPILIFTSSEVLTDETRRLARAAWGQPVYNQYAATEAGGLAAECTAHAGMHLFEDTAIVEVVDAENRPVSPGTYGHKLLVTVLFNYTQPLIRYELSDSIRLSTTSGGCKHPYATIDSVQGRVEEALHFPTLSGGEVSIQPNLFHRLLDTVPARGWQVSLEDSGLRILISGLSENWVESELIENIRQLFSTSGALVPSIWVDRVETIARGKSDKAPLVKDNRNTATMNRRQTEEANLDSANTIKTGR